MAPIRHARTADMADTTMGTIHIPTVEASWYDRAKYSRHTHSSACRWSRTMMRAWGDLRDQQRGQDDQSQLCGLRLRELVVCCRCRRRAAVRQLAVRA